jgi:hypothetical protein
MMMVKEGRSEMVMCLSNTLLSFEQTMHGVRIQNRMKIAIQQTEH